MIDSTHYEGDDCPGGHVGGHDPMCQRDEPDHWCECALIARVRTDEGHDKAACAKRLAHAEAVAARLVEVICFDTYWGANLRREADQAWDERDAARAELARAVDALEVATRQRSVAMAVAERHKAKVADLSERWAQQAAVAAGEHDRLRAEADRAWSALGEAEKERNEADAELVEARAEVEEIRATLRAESRLCAEARAEVAALRALIPIAYGLGRDDEAAALPMRDFDMGALTEEAQHG